MTRPLLSPGAADALLFDLGRVVLDIDFNKTLACWAGHAGCEPTHLVGRFARDEIYHRHETGEISDAEFFAALRASMGIKLSDAQFLEGWNAIFAGEIPGIAHRAAAQARGKTPAALRLLQYQRRPRRTFLQNLCRRARPFP
jgi:putative hydrolase of the HAD superfamily